MLEKIHNFSRILLVATLVISTFFISPLIWSTLSSGASGIPIGAFAQESSDFYAWSWTKLIDETGRKEMVKIILRDSKVATVVSTLPQIFFIDLTDGDILNKTDPFFPPFLVEEIPRGPELYTDLSGNGRYYVSLFSTEDFSKFGFYIYDTWKDNWHTVSLDYRASPEPVSIRITSDGKYVLVGDSFIAGNGNSQEDLLASQLTDRYGIDSYTLAYPAGIPEYMKFILYLERTYGTGFKVLLFLFEGNDFDEAFSRRQFVVKRNAVRVLFDSYRAFFKETVLYRYTFSLAAARTKRTFTSRVFTVGGHRIGEFEEYIRVTERGSYKLPEEAVSALSRVRGRIDHIFFIPTKYRVYYRFLAEGNAKPLPNAQWEAAKALSERLHVPCTDLTGPLVAESEELLRKGRFTFWKDDSHWNRNGIAVAARVVAEQVRAGK